MTAFVGVSCSNEDDFSEVPTPKPSEEVAENIVTFTATLDAKGGSGMRTVNASGVTTWVANEEILISYENTSEASVSAKATVESVDANGKATITATLVEPKDGCQINFYYPYESWKSTSTIDFYNGQDGSLFTLSQYFDHAVDDSQNGEDPYYLSVSGGVATLPSSINMVNPNIIWKLSFTDGVNDITSDITELEIYTKAGPNTFEYSITPTPPITDFFYVAMGPPDDVVFTAHTSSGIYRRAKSGINLVMGKIYTTTGLALTKVEVGKVMGADGNIYTNSTTATAAATSARAMITYVGNDNCESAPYNHGLALALSDAGDAKWRSTVGDAGHTKQPNSSFTSESGLQYNATHNNDTYPAFKNAITHNSSTAPIGCSAWFLASGYQWNKMITTAGGNYITLRDGFDGVGGTNMQNTGYWSSSEVGNGQSWCYNFNGGGWEDISKNGVRKVRSALAF